MRGNGEAGFCLEVVAQWLVHWIPDTDPEFDSSGDQSFLLSLFSQQFKLHFTITRLLSIFQYCRVKCLLKHFGVMNIRKIIGCGTGMCH